MDEIIDNNEVVLDFVCPFCKKEVQENDDIILANGDNLDSFSLEKGPKTFIHVECYKKNKENEK